MRIVEARGLRKTYGGDGADVQALAGVDLDVEPGEFVAIMGPSGSGKSTLLHMIGALDSPDDGRVALMGRELSELSRAELALIRCNQVGFVFQFFNLVGVLTVEENVTLPCMLAGASESDAASRVTDVFARLGLSDKAGKLPSQLSGGEQQRTAIARAVVNAPDLLLADEPTGNLDRRSGGEVMALMRDLNRHGQTVVVVTHDPAVASFAHRVVLMLDGRLVDEISDHVPGDQTSVIERLAAHDA